MRFPLAILTVRGRDELGTETDEMLVERIERSRAAHRANPWAFTDARFA